MHINNKETYEDQLSRHYLGQYSFSHGDISKVPDELPGNQIGFNLNKFGYRTKEFKKFDLNNTNILYTGCSVTAGEYLHEENIWPYFLNSHLQKYFNNIDSYNISYGAASVQAIIKNAMSFIRVYGKPHYIFMCLPGYQRGLYFNKETKLYTNCMILPPKALAIGFTKNDIQTEYNLKYVEENNQLVISTLLTMFDDYCLTNNIKLIWSTWESEHATFYNNLNTKGYFYFDQSNIDENKEDEKLFEYYHIAKDDMHFGVKWHIQYEKEVFDELVKREFIEK